MADYVVPKLEIFCHQTDEFLLVTEGLTQGDVDGMIDPGDDMLNLPKAIMIPANETDVLQIYTYEVYEGGEPTHISTNVFVDPDGQVEPPVFGTVDLLSDRISLPHTGGEINLTVVFNLQAGAGSTE